MHTLDSRTSTGLLRGTVVELVEDGTVIAALADGREVACVRLEAAGAPPAALAPGDEILVHCLDDDATGVVLGRIPRPGATPHSSTGVPDTLVIEETQSLTLRVGDGEITIRDGRILIKGKDLVSHAQRMNRIKGGAVSIN
jgi:hypothetical protein